MKLSKIVESFPIDCKKAALEAVYLCENPVKNRENKLENAIKELIFAINRSEQRRRSDRATDACRRKLVGARVPLSSYEAIKSAADDQGMSLYAWVCLAFAAALAGSRAVCASASGSFAARSATRPLRGRSR